jgi:hypothetical protein
MVTPHQVQVVPQEMVGVVLREVLQEVGIVEVLRVETREETREVVLLVVEIVEVVLLAEVHQVMVPAEVEVLVEVVIPVVVLLKVDNLLMVVVQLPMGMVVLPMVVLLVKKILMQNRVVNHLIPKMTPVEEVVERKRKEVQEQERVL